MLQHCLRLRALFSFLMQIGMRRTRSEPRGLTPAANARQAAWPPHPLFRAAVQNFSDIEVVGINDLLEPDYLAYSNLH